MGTLTIKHVDLGLLDIQRQQINGIDIGNMTLEQGDSLNSIQNMLDYWSDERYWSKKATG